MIVRTKQSTIQTFRSKITFEKVGKRWFMNLKVKGGGQRVVRVKDVIEIRGGKMKSQ